MMITHLIIFALSIQYIPVGKNKLKRFAELETMERVFQPGYQYNEADHPLKGQWNDTVFNNHNPIVIELGCGRGEYTIQMAMHFHNKNFVGIDKKGARLWKGAKTSNEHNILNAAFLRIPIEHLASYFAPGEISEIWITFPDPQPQKTRENTRMTSQRFLDMYRDLLIAGGLVHLKTDNIVLFEYSIEMLKDNNVNIHQVTRDLYAEPLEDKILQIKTTYEKRYLDLGFNICYVKFSF